jgi:hypothetical protein
MLQPKKEKAKPFGAHGTITPKFGSIKKKTKLNKEGEVKSEKTVSRDMDGKKTSVVKTQYASGTSNLGMKVRRAAARAGSALGMNRDIEMTKSRITKTKRK